MDWICHLPSFRRGTDQDLTRWDGETCPSLEVEGKTIPHHCPTCVGVHTLILFTSSKLKEFFQVSSIAWNNMIMMVQKYHYHSLSSIGKNQNKCPNTCHSGVVSHSKLLFFPICQLPTDSPDMDRDLMDFVWGFSFRWGRSIGVPLGSGSSLICEWKAAAWTLTASLSWCNKKICKSCLARMPECKKKKWKDIAIATLLILSSNFNNITYDYIISHIPNLWKSLKYLSYFCPNMSNTTMTSYIHLYSTLYALFFR